MQFKRNLFVKDGLYVGISNEDDLKYYVVTAQDIEANTEFKLEFEKDSGGNEYSKAVRNKLYNEMELTVKRFMPNSFTDEILEPF